MSTKYVGIDDGHGEIKVCFGFNDETGKFDCTSIKSIALSGLNQIVSFNGEGAAYHADGETFSIAGDNALGRPLETRFLDYPKSALNRVLVAHALSKAGFGGMDVAIVTGLPVDQYYQSGRKNDKLISEKQANLCKEVVPVNKNLPLANIVQNAVISEGIGAIYYAMLNGDGSEKDDMISLIERRPITVIDMGAKTLDVATIAEGVEGIYYDKSGTADIGVLKLKEDIAAQIKSEFNLNSEPPAKYIEEAIRTKKYEIFGDINDVSHIVEKFCQEYVEQVKNFVFKKIADGSDIGAVILVGGGTAILKSVFGEAIFGIIYRGKKIIPEDPEYANACGMWLAATYLEVSWTHKMLDKQQLEQSELV